ncbi:MAG: hypothetical protein V7608_4958 [Hyphomicrobiales bacterium]
METNTAGQLKQAVATLSKLFRLARDAGLADTAQFLAMAKLHLLMDLNGISDKEFRALCDHLEGKAAKPSRLAPSRGAAARNRREAEMRLTGRAWQCSGEAPRGGRTRARG